MIAVSHVSDFFRPKIEWRNITTSKVNEPSNFWEELNRDHAKHLSQTGIKNFKRSINTRYFNWGVIGIYTHQLRPIIWCLKRGKVLRLFQAEYKISSHNPKKIPELSYPEAFLYKTYAAALYEYVKAIDHLDLLGKIQEPDFGNPFFVSYRGKLITQDLCNSIFEFYSITNDIKMPEHFKILEIGAGYGRLAYIFLKVFPNCSYTIVDIEPALSVSKQYLEKVLPKKSRLKFIRPDEVSLVPGNSFNLIVSVSTFPEMTLGQIKYYFFHINRLCRGYFYTKQLTRSWTGENHFIVEDNYPSNASWQVVYKRTHPIQKLFFEALYKIM